MPFRRRSQSRELDHVATALGDDGQGAAAKGHVDGGIVGGITGKPPW
jgi:hypothetical protein